MLLKTTTRKRQIITVCLGLQAILFFSAPLLAQDSKGASAAEVKQEVAETYQALKRYTLEQRDQAVKTADEKLQQLDQQIAELQKKVDQDWQEMSQTSRDKTRETLKALQKQREKAAEWFGGMRHSSADAWDEVKKGFADSVDRLGQAFDKAKKEFTQKN